MPNPTGPIEELIAQTPDWRGATMKRLRKIIRDSDPEIIEEVKWRRPGNPLGAPVWEHNGIVCVGNILKKRPADLFRGREPPRPAQTLQCQARQQTGAGNRRP